MIALPASAHTVLEQVVNPELAALPMQLRTNVARIALLAIGVQETNLAHRQQVNGPARSFWQFEHNGIVGVLTHPNAGGLADQVCERHWVPTTADAIYEAMLTDDGLGCAFARLLLLTDPYTLPSTADGLWDVYTRVWRPGKPDRGRWDRAFRMAEDAVL